MLDAAASPLGFEVIADGGREATPPMRRCHGERPNESNRLVDFQPPNTDDCPARLRHHKGLKVFRYACGRKRRIDEKLGDRREVTRICGSYHRRARAA